MGVEKLEGGLTSIVSSPLRYKRLDEDSMGLALVDSEGTEGLKLRRFSPFCLVLLTKTPLMSDPQREAWSSPSVLLMEQEAPRSPGRTSTAVSSFHSGGG